MTATLEPVMYGNFAHGVIGVPRKPRSKPTKPVRVHTEVAIVLEMMAKLFGRSVPDLASELLEKQLEPMRGPAAERLLGAQEGDPRRSEDKKPKRG